MGSHYDFKCTACGFGAEVSGGDDRGFTIHTRTMYCRSCEALNDVAIGSCNEDPIPPDQASGEREFGKCPTCGGIDLARWSVGDPCPRCGGSVTKGMLTKLWD